MMRTIKGVRKATQVAAAAALAMALCALALAGCSSPASSAGTDASSSATSASSAVSDEASAEADALQIGSLKGPTSVGIASMMADGQGEFTVAAAADEIAPKLVQGELDIALIPANLAATLYQKTDGAIRVIDVNTLGVLYAVSAANIDGVEGLRGRTVYMTGKGTVPEYTLRALLQAASIPAEEVDIQFRSEPAEVAALIAQEPESVGILPQPFATSAVLKNDSLEQRIDLTTAWEDATGGERGSLITGVTVAMADTVDAKNAAIDEFISRHKASVDVAQNDPEQIVPEVVSLGIIDNAEIASVAIPRCNVVCLTGEEMKEALSGYLDVLFELDPTSIGGNLPKDDFYLM